MTLTYDEYRKVSYFGALDGVRAVAVLMVVTWHVPGGYFRDLQGYRGVLAFFVLSGFLITTLGLREETKTGRLRVSGFFVRRVFRILPLYYVVLLANVVVVYVISSDAFDRSAFSRSLPYYLTFMQEYPRAAFFANAPFSVSWSLGIEEKFYLVWPIIGFLLLRGRRDARIGVLGLTTFAIVVVGSLDPGSLVARLTTEYAFVLVGCLLAVLLHDPRLYDRLKALGTAPVVVGAALATAVVWVLAPRTRTADYIFGLLVVVVIGGLVMGHTLLTSALSGRVITWIGRISYPLYLVHVLALTFANKVVGVPGGPSTLSRSMLVLVCGLAGALVASEVLHRIVEVPMIRVGRRLSARLAARGDGGATARDETTRGAASEE